MTISQSLLNQIKIKLRIIQIRTFNLSKREINSAEFFLNLFFL